jgi:hypothetical protein
MNGRPNPTSPDLAPPAAVMPQPVETVINTAQVPAAGGGQLIVVQFQTPVGTSVFFLHPDTARALGVELQKLGSAGRLTIAAPG